MLTEPTKHLLLTSKPVATDYTCIVHKINTAAWFFMITLIIVLVNLSSVTTSHGSIARGYHVYKDDWIPDNGDGFDGRIEKDVLLHTLSLWQLAASRPIYRMLFSLRRLLKSHKKFSKLKNLPYKGLQEVMLQTYQATQYPSLVRARRNRSI